MMEVNISWRQSPDCQKNKWPSTWVLISSSSRVCSVLFLILVFCVGVVLRMSHCLWLCYWRFLATYQGCTWTSMIGLPIWGFFSASSWLSKKTLCHLNTSCALNIEYSPQLIVIFYKSQQWTFQTLHRSLRSRMLKFLLLKFCNTSHKQNTTSLQTNKCTATIASSNLQWTTAGVNLTAM